MSLNQSLLAELKQEGASTRKMLQAVPFNNPSWKPHDKSMSLEHLASHIAELMGWISMTIHTNELDFAKLPYKPLQHNSTEDLLKLFDEKFAAATADLSNATDENLRGPWTLRNGETIYFTMPRIGVIRSMALNHSIHHRGQLSVYLRLNDIPLPGMYGPTADEKM